VKKSNAKNTAENRIIHKNVQLLEFQEHSQPQSQQTPWQKKEQRPSFRPDPSVVQPFKHEQPITNRQLVSHTNDDRLLRDEVEKWLLTSFPKQKKNSRDWPSFSDNETLIQNLMISFGKNIDHWTEKLIVDEFNHPLQLNLIARVLELGSWMNLLEKGFSPLMRDLRHKLGLTTDMRFDEAIQKKNCGYLSQKSFQLFGWKRR
jgi:hypothetical protein